MKVVRGVLCVLAIISLYFTAGNALAAAAHPVCSTPDFMEFVTKYANLTAKEQFTCVQLPFTNEKKKYTSTDALYKAIQGRRLIFTPKDFLAPYKAWTPLFVPSGTELYHTKKGPGGRNVTHGPGGHGMVYFVKTGKTGHDVEVILTIGGTQIIEVISFTHKNNVWWAHAREKPAHP